MQPQHAMMPAQGVAYSVRPGEYQQVQQPQAHWRSSNPDINLSEQYRPAPQGSPNYPFAINSSPYSSGPSTSFSSYPVTPQTPFTPSKSQSQTNALPSFSSLQQGMRDPSSPHLSSSVRSIHSSQRAVDSNMAPSAAYPTYQNATPVHDGGSQRGGSIRGGEFSIGGGAVSARERESGANTLRSSVTGFSDFSPAPFPSNLHGSINGRDKAESVSKGGVSESIENPAKLGFSTDMGVGNFKAALGNLDAMKIGGDEDKDKTIQRLQAELSSVQRAHQDSMNRSAILSSQSAALQEQLMLAGDRERGMKAKESQLADKVKSLEAKVHMMTDVKDNWTAIKKESEDKDARLQEAERQLAQFVAARKLEEEQGHQAVVDEFMKRLSDKEKEVDAAQAQVKALADKLEDKDRRLLQMAKSQQQQQQQQQQQNSSSTHSSLQSAASERSTVRSEPRDDEAMSKLKERVKIVEEALRAMRDEAREHVLAIKSSDILLNNILGSGSFAEVHSATWNLPCAVKRLKDGVRSNKYEVQKFQREAYLLRSLLHPGVLRVFGFCKVDFLLVTEVVTGGSLHSIIHGNPPIPAPRLEHQAVLEYSSQVADILRYLHLCNVVHRDIKPENLLVDQRGTLKLADFGLACEKKGAYIQTRSNLAGTPRYMAPESYRDERCTERIDIYSLSMLMWEMKTGQLPWEGSNFQDVRHAVATAGERPPIPADCPASFAQLLRDCWHPIPECRPSASEVLNRIAAMGVRSKFLELRERRHKEEKERRDARADKAASSKDSHGSSSAKSGVVTQKEGNVHVTTANC